MAGVYVHIPLCKTKCRYCDFYSVIDISYKTDIIEALRKEIELRKDYLNNEIIHTIYFGGGTPSLLSASEINNILDSTHQHHVVHKDAEITVEVNPNDITREYAQELRNIGINRLSIGIQSFHDDDLQFLGRRHNAHEAVNAIVNAHDAGFDNINIDFIYGHQLCTFEKIENNIQAAYSFDIKHVSLYHITYEFGTELFKLLESGIIKKLSEDESVKQYELVMQKMSTYGYIHYEISNFAQKGFFSKHNSNYWSGEKYIGIGPAAHSYNDESRQWNEPDVKTYIERVKKGDLVHSKEKLTSAEKCNEYIMTRLRTMWGINIEEMGKIFSSSVDLSDTFKTVEVYITSGKLERNGKTITLTGSGKLIADRIISDMFVS